MASLELIPVQLLILLGESSALAATTPPGSEPVAWPLRLGGLIAVATLAAALMVLMQTRHRGRSGILWVLVVFFIPILGPLVYLIAQSINYRRNNPAPTKGRAETMAPEEYSGDPEQVGDDDAGPRRTD